MRYYVIYMTYKGWAAIPHDAREDAHAEAERLSQYEGNLPVLLTEAKVLQGWHGQGIPDTPKENPEQ